MQNNTNINLTYITGAGASIGAIPIIKDPKISFQDNLMIFMNEEIRHEIEQLPEDNSFLRQYHKDLQWLIPGIERFGTPDTFAKYCQITDRNLLRLFKKTISFYFLKKQFVDCKTDKRPLSFLTVMLDSKLIFPKNVKIFNWNYDFQFQISSNLFRNELFSQSGKISKHSPGILSYYPSYRKGGPKDRIVNGEFDMIHLNGIAGFYNDTNSNSIMSYMNGKQIMSLSELIGHFTSEYDSKDELFTFAWEEDSSLELRNTIIPNFARRTDYLVIIGYSFPFFNRKIDQQIFASINQENTLKKIYYQDPFKSGEFLRSQFNIHPQVEIIDIPWVDNYYIPYEF